MFTQLSPTYKGILFALAGYTGFSGADICVKWLTQSYSVYQVVALETGIGLAFLLALSPWLGGTGDLWRRENLKIHGLRAVLNFLINLLYASSIAVLPIAAVYTFVFAKPFIAAAIAIPLYKQAVGVNRWLAIAMGFAGILIALRPGSVAFDPVLLLPVGVTFLIAVMFLISRSLDHGASLFSLGFFPLAGSFVLTLPLMMMDFSPIALADLPIFALAAALATSAIVLVSLAFRVAEAALVAPFMYTQMIWGLLAGYLLFHDVPDVWMLAGASVIIASGIYLIETERRI